MTFTASTLAGVKFCNRAPSMGPDPFYTHTQADPIRPNPNLTRYSPMALEFLWPLIILNTKTGGNSSGSACLWRHFRDSLF